ncbi:FG-GAP-like repeat-containing protein [Rhodopirellula sp. P2]|uniref:FG-GAP-like repeat-containing protein n=1 Tax=Rhodopirellula sp. P2 TaxID=2127060 RepID=UPI002367BA03|nr:FG-GAP-like repeat-containing protein [Rhodopirellula sp. P2]WDQ16052.1 FG-GAP-like repeat-containing protein [Rhodopirellula sp. P2]
MTTKLPSGLTLHFQPLHQEAIAARHLHTGILLGSLLLSGLVGCREKEPVRIVPKMQTSVEAAPAQAPDARELLASAEKAVTQGNWSDAKRFLKDLLVAKPDHPAGLFLMSRVQAETGHLDDAIEMLANIPDNDAEFGIAALGQRGEFLRQVGRNHEAIQVWQTLLAKPSVANDPFSNQIRSQLAADLQRVGRRIEAGEQLRILVKQSAANEDQLRQLLYITRPPKTREEFAAEVERERLRTQGVAVDSPDASASSDLNSAWTSLIERRTREAIETLQAVIKHQPSMQAQALLAYAYADLQAFPQMRATIVDANSNSSLPGNLRDFPSFWMAVGAQALFEQSTDDAIGAFAEAMRLDPTSDRAHELLSAALLQAGRVNDAEAVDERRYLLAGPREAYVAVGDGQPDDLRAGRFLVEDLLRLGEMDQACEWRKAIAKRHRGQWGSADEIQQDCAQWKSLAKEERLKRQLAGISIEGNSKPDLAWLRSTPKDISSTIRSPTTPSGQPSFTPPRLVDVAVSVGLQAVFHNRPERVLKLMRLHESLGPGTAALDYDRDGQIDFYINQASGDPPQSPGTRPNHLFRGTTSDHEPPVYVDATAPAAADDRGYGVGLTAGDWNQDGWEDLAIANVGQNRLLLNQGDGTFIDATNGIGWNSEQFTASLAMADMDGNGSPDLIEINYADDPRVFEPVQVNSLGLPTDLPGPNHFRAANDQLWLSDPQGQARQVILRRDAIVDLNRETPEQSSPSTPDPPQASGTHTPKNQLPKLGDDAFPGLGLIAGELDGQPGLECFVANDSRPNQFWKISRNGSIVKLLQYAETIGLATSSQGKTTACMGVGAADFDRNGTQDMVVANWYDEWLNLYQQVRPGMYRDVAIAFGLDRFSDHHVGFGIQGLDYDNDGWVDLVIGNGHIEDLTHQQLPLQMETQVLVNLGDHFEQADMKSTLGGYWDTPHIGRSLTRCDHNRDGRLDALLSDLHDPLALLENQTESDHHWIQFSLVATSSERSAIGTRIEVLGTEKPAVASLNAGDGFACRNEPVVHLGLANRSDPVDVQITWPSGEVQTLGQLSLDRRYLVVENQLAWPE